MIATFSSTTLETRVADVGARRFTLDITAATDGVTEVCLPRRHLGASPHISVVGALASRWVAAREFLLLVAAQAPRIE